VGKPKEEEPPEEDEPPEEIVPEQLPDDALYVHVS